MDLDYLTDALAALALAISPGSISTVDILVITSLALGYFPWTLCAGSQAPVGLDVVRDLGT
jgi:hypothetical protein